MHFGFIGVCGHMFDCHRNNIHMVQKESFSYIFHSRNLVKLVPSLNEKVPTLNSLLPILSELTSSKNNENVITPVAVSQLSPTPPDELILPHVLVPQLQVATDKPSTTIDIPLYHESTPKFSAKEIKTQTLIFRTV